MPIRFAYFVIYLLAKIFCISGSKTLGAQAIQWKCIGPFHTDEQLKNQNFGMLTAIAAHPIADSTDIYVGGNSGGLWHTTNGGTTWNCITNTSEWPVLGVHHLFVDFNKAQRKIVIAAGSGTEAQEVLCAGVLYSEDNGATWQQSTFEGLNLTYYNRKVYAMCKVNELVYYCYIEGTICKSVDGAKTFKKIFSDSQMSTIIPGGANTVVRTILYDEVKDVLLLNRQATNKWIDGKNEVYETKVFAIENISASDNSTFKIIDFTKQIVSKQLGSGRCTGLQITKSNADANTINVLQTWENAKPQCYKINATNYVVTATWLPQVPNEMHSYEHFPCIVPQNNNAALQYLCAYTCSKSEDSGKTFVSSYGYSFGDNNTPHTDVRSMLISKASADGKTDHILLGTDGGLSFSNDGGKTFRNLNGVSLPVTQFSGISVSPFSGNISAGSQDNSIMTYDAKSKKWVIAIRGDGYDVSYSKTRLGVCIGEYNYCQPSYTTQDVVPFANYMSIDNERTSQFRNLISTKNGNTFFARERLFINKDGSANWNATKSKADLSDLITSTAIGGENDEYMYIAARWQDEQRSVWRSENGGVSWENISQSKSNDSNEHVLGWHKIMALECTPDGNTVFASFGYFSDDNNMYNGKRRIWMSTNAGNNWVDISDGLPALPNWDLKYHEASNSLFCCNALGVYVLNLSAFVLKWQKFGEGLPLCFNTEIDIDILNNRIVLGTFGNGLWAADLPSTFLRSKTIARKAMIIQNSDTLASATLVQPIILKRTAKLIIRQPLYIGKDVFIKARNKQQLVFEGRGKIVPIGKTLEECLLFEQ
jgi:photosystem II stability/assembly factor-like uncharacterized protein